MSSEEVLILNSPPPLEQRPRFSAAQDKYFSDEESLAR